MKNVVDTLQYTIFMAGDIEQAKQVCREYCYNIGLCVTIEPTLYIYTGGEEQGFRVGLINYPRFPDNEIGLETKAVRLADTLLDRLHQHSYTIAGPRQTQWLTRRQQP